MTWPLSAILEFFKKTLIKNSKKVVNEKNPSSLVNPFRKENLHLPLRTFLLSLHPPRHRSIYLLSYLSVNPFSYLFPSLRTNRHKERRRIKNQTNQSIFLRDQPLIVRKRKTAPLPGVMTFVNKKDWRCYYD